VGVLATLVVVAIVVLAGGRDDKRHVTRRTGDVAVAPLAATRCEASAEAGSPNLFCTRTPAGRYQVIFYEDSVLIYRAGDPDNPRAIPWKP
jgi:hypothetical protein